MKNMKKWLAIMLALLTVFALVACGGDADDPGKDSNKKPGKTNATDGNGDPADPSDKPADEDCVICFDLATPIDRKCDTCGKWIYPDGEAWTAEIPQNLKVIVADSNFFYVVEKIGDAFYIRMWSDRASYEKGDTPYEDYGKIDARYTRYKGNNATTEWEKQNYMSNYADLPELFAIEVFRSLGGTVISDLLTECKKVTTAGTETLIGKECAIKEYSGLFGTEYKVWLWNSIPLKRVYKEANDTEYKLAWEIYEWDTTITAFSTDVPA